MKSLFLWNFIVPLTVGICIICVLAWIYMLNDFGIWKLFIHSKHRARSIWSLSLALVIYTGIVTLFYEVVMSAAVLTTHRISRPANVHIVLNCVVSCSEAIFAYVLADSLVEKYGKIGPKRPPVGSTYVGIGSSHASQGGGRYI